MTTPPQDSGAGFVGKVVTDPANVPDVILLYGYAGASNEPGHQRLYLSRDLSAYVEIPDHAILHRQASPQSEDSLGGETLWVRRDAALKHKSSPTANALAHYFAGAIAGAQAAAPGAMNFGGGPGPFTPVRACQINTNDPCAPLYSQTCPSQIAACPPVGGPVSAAACPPVGGPASAAACVHPSNVCGPSANFCYTQPHPNCFTGPRVVCRIN